MKIFKLKLSKVLNQHSNFSNTNFHTKFQNYLNSFKLKLSTEVCRPLHSSWCRVQLSAQKSKNKKSSLIDGTAGIDQSGVGNRYGSMRIGRLLHWRIGGHTESEDHWRARNFTWKDTSAHTISWQGHFDSKAGDLLRRMVQWYSYSDIRTVIFVPASVCQSNGVRRVTMQLVVCVWCVRWRITCKERRSLAIETFICKECDVLIPKDPDSGLQRSSSTKRSPESKFQIVQVERWTPPGKLVERSHKSEESKDKLWSLSIEKDFSSLKLNLTNS